MDWLSDWLLNRTLRFAASKTEFAAVGRDQRSHTRARAGGKAAAAAAAKHDRNGPEDVATATEAMEALLPSAEPASGRHPHAPGRPTDAPDPSPTGLAGGVEPLERGRRKALLAELGGRYSATIEKPRELEELVALLGEQHIFQLE